MDGPAERIEAHKPLMEQNKLIYSLTDRDL